VPLWTAASAVREREEAANRKEVREQRAEAARVLANSTRPIAMPMMTPAEIRGKALATADKRSVAVHNDSMQNAIVVPTTSGRTGRVRKTKFTYEQLRQRQ
jgi:hypothetical protein